MIELGPEAANTLRLLAELQHSDIVIKKTGYNSFGKYQYPTLDDILDAVQPALQTYNCVIVWSEDNHEHTYQELPSDKGGTDYYVHTDSILTCRIMNVQNPKDYIQSTSHGYGINKNADKTCKATTIGKRYALINLLAIKAVNDEDTDNSAFDVNNVGEAAKNWKRSRKQPSIDDKRKSSNLIM